MSSVRDLAGASAPAAAVERDAARYAPVFVLAPARSFSSVVTAMVGGHPELYGFLELTLFEQATLGDRLEVTPHPTVYPRSAPWNPVVGLERTLAQLHDGRQDDDTIARAREWIGERRQLSGAEAFDHLLELVAPRSGVENSPGTSRDTAVLERAAEAYPRARFIHLTRHPTSTARSLRDVYLLTGREYACSKAWFTYHERIAAFCATLEPGRTMRVRGEDVLNDTGELERIAGWLGVSTDADAIEAMRHPERSPYAAPGPAEAMGGADGAFLRDPLPRRVELPSEREVPADWNVPPDLRAKVVELAETLGY